MSYREGIDTTPGGFPYRQAPHGYCGSNSDRQSVGDPGHCEDCCSVGHIVAHPDLGCAEVGCYSDHVDEPVSVSPDPPGLPPVCATCGNPITHTGAGYRHVNPILDVVTGHESTPAQVAREQTAVHTNTSVTGITDEMIELGAQAIAEEIGMRGQLYPVESPDFPAHRRRVAEVVLRGALAGRAVVNPPAGYMIAGPNRHGRMEADWDGVVHETREAGEAELARCQETYTDWQLYALHPVTGPGVAGGGAQ